MLKLRIRRKICIKYILKGSILQIDGDSLFNLVCIFLPGSKGCLRQGFLLRQKLDMLMILEIRLGAVSKGYINNKVKVSLMMFYFGFLSSSA